MNKPFVYIITFSILTLCFLGMLGTRTVLYAEIDEEVVEEKERRQEEIKDEKSKLQQELEEKRKIKKGIVQDLWDTDRNLNWTRQKLTKKENDLSRKRAQKEIITTRLNEAEKDLDTTQVTFEDRLRVYYKNGAKALLSVIVDAKDLSDLVFRLRYTEELLTHDEETITSILEQQAMLAKMKEELTQEVKAEESLCYEITAERTKFQKLHNRKVALRNEISKDINATENLLNEIIKEETEIEFFLEAAARGNLSTNFDGSFAKPLQSYQISSGFGMRTHPIFRRRKMHNGIDLTSPKNTPIHASGAGRVIFAGWKKGYGNTVMINHGKGYSTLYGHMSMILVSVNQDVMEGQPIGKVGSTGISTGNHLHFEIRVNGKPKNPINYLSF